MADAAGSLPLELLDRGDPSFVDAIRRVHDADVLAAFAEVWYADPRPASRQLLFEYLDQLLNAYHHEGLIKRLFKKADAAGDDEVMAWFLVLFDRSIRRFRKTRTRRSFAEFATRPEAEATVSLWKNQGYQSANLWGHASGFQVYGSIPEQVVRQPSRTVMPRGRMIELQSWLPPAGKFLVPDWAILLGINWQTLSKEFDIGKLPEVRKRLEKFRLFSVATRSYLRRRAWRYFRKLGQTHPDRYVAAVSRALASYRDDDVADSLALIDNWGLIHVLFHHSPVLDARANGWVVKAGRSLGELAPAPIFEALWDQAPGATVELLMAAKSATVRRWALRRIEADPTTHRSGTTLEGWLALLGHQDAEIVAIAARVLEGMDGLETVGVDRWLALAESADPAAVEVLGGLIDRYVKADQVTLEQAVTQARSRALPLAKLGLAWLKTKSVREPNEVISLIDAECALLRPEILRWLRTTLAALPDFEPAWIFEFLDSPHADARLEGWTWFRTEPRAADDFEAWRKLLESPYDDIRLALVGELESRSQLPLGSGDLRSLWASVLLNIHRGSRARPVVVRQLLGRLAAHPDEASALLPLLGIALRSVRGPERRAGLVAIVQLIEKREDVEPLVRSTFPELQWVGDPQR